MSNTLENLRHKITGAKDLESVVRTMKVLAASNIIQYEKAVVSLNDYYRTIEMGLSICFRNAEELQLHEKESSENGPTGVLVFGSDQGLVGQFNDLLADFVLDHLKNIKGEKQMWAIGERIKDRIEDSGLNFIHTFTLPNSVNTITSVITQMLIHCLNEWENGRVSQFYIFHNKPKTGTFYEPTVTRFLPLDDNWRNAFVNIPWPTRKIPEAMFGIESSLQGLIRSYLFVTLYKACAESLASENASRLAAMQRAEKNINELLDDLTLEFHQFRQSAIDEELFDVISGSEALMNGKSNTHH